jgi:hypothetical protein
MLARRQVSPRSAWPSWVTIWQIIDSRQPAGRMTKRQLDLNQSALGTGTQAALPAEPPPARPNAESRKRSH